MVKQSNNVAPPSGMKRGQWTPQEDEKLFSFIMKYGHGSWRTLPQKAGLQRCGKSCRLRWKNYLNPDIKRGNFSLQEDQTIIQLHALLGNRWSAIAAQLPKRTDNEVKNYWNTRLKKLLAKKGYDPVTHKRKTPIFANEDKKSLSNLSHIAQWETARLQAEARFAKQSKLLVNNKYDQVQPNTDVFMNERAREVLMLLKSVLGGGQGGHQVRMGNEIECVEGGQGGHQVRMGNEIECVEGGQIISNYDQFVAPRITSTISSVEDFNHQGFGEVDNNEYREVLDALLLQHCENSSIGFEVWDANWSLDQYM